jgi:carboxymethylenebutenolidase
MIEDWLANAYEGMSRRQFLAQMSVASATLAGLAIAAKPVAGEIISTPTLGLIATKVSLTSGNFQIPMYEARPEASGKYPVVLVIPEIFGMHEHIKDVTRRFAKAGYLSITFEPYAREGGVLNLPDIDAVRKVVNVIPDQRVMEDLDAVLAYAKGHPAALPDRIGVTGFCRGGMYTLLFAAHNHAIKAAVAWYGQIRPTLSPGVRSLGPLDIASRIKAPVLGLYGGEDLGIPVADVKAMESALISLGKTAHFVVYPGAPHAFYADYRPSYRPDAAKDAWGRCMAWFNKYMKS